MNFVATLVGGGFLNGTAEMVALDGLVWTLPPFGICIGLSIGKTRCRSCCPGFPKIYRKPQNLCFAHWFFELKLSTPGHLKDILPTIIIDHVIKGKNERARRVIPRDILFTMHSRGHRTIFG